MRQLSQQEIINHLQEIAHHDSHADFQIVYNHYYNKLFHQALSYLKEPELVQELISDVFVALWQSRKILDKIENPDAYFFIALKHARYKFIQKYYKEQHELLIEELPEISSSSISDTEIIEKELNNKYQTALQKLPPRCAEVFRLVREEKKKYQEVAEIMNISVKTVDNQMNKAVKILYNELKEHLFSVFF